MTPPYDGKGQPPTTPGWFTGLTSWWNGLTPAYVTAPSRGTSAAPRSSTDSTTTHRLSEAPAGAPDKATLPPSNRLAAAATVASPTSVTTKP